MSKPQKYPDLSTVRMTTSSYFDNRAGDILVLFKKGAQYTLCNVKDKSVFHATEKQIDASVEKAKIFDSPLMKAITE
jgi:hypothetical protein